MTTAYMLHGEVGGPVTGNSNSMRAEGFTSTNSSAVQFKESSPSPHADLAGNGGKYSIGSTSNSVHVQPMNLHGAKNQSYRTVMVRFSIYRTSSTEMDVYQPFSNSNSNYLWLLRFSGTQLRIMLREGHLTVQKALVSGFNYNQWHTFWVIGIVSTFSGSSLYSTGLFRVFKTDPRANGASAILEIPSAFIGFKSNSFANVSISTSPTKIKFSNSGYIDDMVAHVPSMEFVSSGQTLPAVDDTVRHTDGSGNVVTALVSGVTQLPDVGGKAAAILTLHRMNYVPSGGSTAKFNGIGWGGGVTQPWGTGSVAITDNSDNPLGTGTYDYRRGTFPREGFFMPVAKPVSADATMTPSTGTVADSYQLVDDLGGDLNPTDWVYGDSSGEYWQGDFDDTTEAGNAKLVVTGNPSVNRVVTYVWGRAEGTGSGVSGNINHYNIVTGNAFNTRAEATITPLGGGWGLSRSEHPVCATGSEGSTVEWTVSLVNAASFGIVTG